MPDMAEPVWLDSVPLTVTVLVVEPAYRGLTPVMEMVSERE
jgi:hypothetical protein